MDQSTLRPPALLVENLSLRSSLRRSIPSTNKDFVAECHLHDLVATGTEHVVAIRDFFEEEVTFGDVTLQSHVAVLDYVDGTELDVFLSNSQNVSARTHSRSSRSTSFVYFTHWRGRRSTTMTCTIATSWYSNFLAVNTVLKALDEAVRPRRRRPRLACRPQSQRPAAARTRRPHQRGLVSRRVCDAPTYESRRNNGWRLPTRKRARRARNRHYW